MALSVSTPSLRTVEAPPKVTYAAYRAMPDDGNRYELVEGVLREMPAPNVAHQRTLRNLFRVMDKFVAEKSIGEVLFAPVDVHLHGDLNYQPDLLFISKDNVAKITEQDIEGAPDLVVEIVSHGSRRIDRVEKHVNYAKQGVREYWLVYPADRFIEVFGLKESKFEMLGRYGEGEIVRSQLLDGLEFLTESVFD